MPQAVPLGRNRLAQAVLCDRSVRERERGGHVQTQRRVGRDAVERRQWLSHGREIAEELAAVQFLPPGQKSGVLPRGQKSIRSSSRPSSTAGKIVRAPSAATYKDAAPLATDLAGFQ